LSQKPKEEHRRTRFKSLWKNIDELIRKQIIVISSEIMEEVDDKDVQDSLKQQNCRVIDVDEEVQAKVAKVVTARPGLVDFKQNKSSGDAFLIATAMKYGLIVITEENPDKQFKIPKVCQCLGVKCIDILGLCELEDWEF
jgi:quinolinate synthase